MPTFAYLARSSAGGEISGILSGTNSDEVVDNLHRQGLVVLNVVEAPDKSRRQAGSGSSGLSLIRPSTRDLALFNRQLATLLESGIPLVRGLQGLAADSGSRVLARAVRDIALRIERGESMSDAMAAHPEAFNNMYLSMVRAGERSGTLAEIIDQLAIYLEKVDALRNKVRSAMAYPVFVLIFAVSVTAFLLFKIVPTFEQIYGDFGQALPRFTQIIITASNAVRAHTFVVLMATAGLVLLVFLGGRTRMGRYMIDDFLLRLPIFGPIVRKAAMSRFARTFGMLIRSGLPILEAMELVSGASGNAVIAKAVRDAKAKVAAGHGITESLRSTGKFPELVLQLMGTGEEAGNLDSMLIKSSDFYDREVEAAVQGLSSLIEPLMIVLVGAMVGVIVVAMFLPIFNLGDAILKGGYR
jgi:type IV pilus assembly protein PilC